MKIHRLKVILKNARRMNFKISESEKNRSVRIWHFNTYPLHENEIIHHSNRKSLSFLFHNFSFSFHSIITKQIILII